MKIPEPSDEDNAYYEMLDRHKAEIVKSIEWCDEIIKKRFADQKKLTDHQREIIGRLRFNHRKLRELEELY